MKNLIKLIGIIALVAVIWFSFAACDDDGDNDNGGGGNDLNGGGGNDDGTITVGDWIWVAYDDENNGGNSTITMTESSGTLTFTGEIKDAIGYPFAGFCAFPNDSILVSLKTAVSIKFDFKGDGKTYKFIMPTSDIEDWSHYETTFTPASDDWESITINESELAQPDWGDPKGFNRNLIEMVKWQTDNGATGTFSVSIRNLTLIQP